MRERGRAGWCGDGWNTDGAQQDCHVDMLTIVEVAETAAALPAPSGGFGSSPAAAVEAGMLSDIETT